MNQSKPGIGVAPTTGLEPSAPRVGGWIAAWTEIVLLGYLAILGAFFASANAAPGDSACGLILSIAATLLAFLRLKGRFDGPADGLATFLLVDDWANLTAVIAIFSVLGLAGLFFAAAAEYGGLHNSGIALFVVSGIFVFLNLRRVFDNLERRG